MSNLYKTKITATTIKMWIMLPKSGNAKYPTSQPITNNTTISQIKSLIIVGCFSVTLSYKLIVIDFKKIYDLLTR